MITTLLPLALKSLLNRQITASLTLATLSLSVMLILGVERIHNEAKESFANTISGTDVIVGARSGSVQLLLYSVFRVGNATSNISWRSYKKIKEWKDVAWTVPISLGDSHRGYRVLGTTRSYFDHYRFGYKQNLQFSNGTHFNDLFDAVIGWDAAKTLGYKVGDPLIVQHGLGDEGFLDHKDKPFRVSGILAKTGTPVDRTIHVSLRAIEAIHIDWRSGAPVQGLKIDADQVRKMKLLPREITAIFLGTKSRFGAFSTQRYINTFSGEPLLAILPGVALHELWTLMSTAEVALSTISVLVVASSILGMLTMLLASLNERRREMAILRAVGARPVHIFALLIIEALTLAIAASIVGTFLFYIALFISQPFFDAHFGLFITIQPPSDLDAIILISFISFSTIAGALPGWRAYRESLKNGLSIKT